jgi:hypothetical protein
MPCNVFDVFSPKTSSLMLTHLISGFMPKVLKLNTLVGNSNTLVFDPYIMVGNLNTLVFNSYTMVGKLNTLVFKPYTKVFKLDTMVFGLDTIAAKEAAA